MVLSATWHAPAASQETLSTHPRVASTIELLDAWLQAELDYGQIPGISVGIVHDQELVWASGFGWADPDARVPATSSTLYKACSLVKPFTAMAVLQLRDRGAISLDDRVAAHLEWFEVEDPFPDDPGEITLETLVTHSSGLPLDLPLPYWTGPDYPFPTREAFKQAVRTLHLTHPPGTQYQYSNVGLSLAGEVVSSVSGVPYGEFIERHIFEPVGMKETAIDPPVDALPPRLAAGYSVLQRDGGRMRIQPYQLNALAPAAGLVTSVEDLARFASWQFRTLDGEGEDILSRGTLRSMHQVQWMNTAGWGRSGYGYQTWAENDRHFVGHAGACPGYETKLLMRPTERLAVLVMTNAQGPDVDGYAQRIYDLVSPALRTTGADPHVADAGREWERFEGRYVRPYGRELEVTAWGGGLAILPLPTSDPRRAMEVLEPVADGVFRRQDGSGASADLVRFERGPGGELRMWRNHQYFIRVE